MAGRSLGKTSYAPSDALALYKGLFDNISSGVAIYEAVDGGEDFVFVDFNRAGEEIDRVRRADLVGRKVTEAFPAVKEFGLFEVLQRVWATGTAERHPVSLYKDGRIAGWRDNHVFKLPGGEVVAVYDDLTAQKRTESQFRQLAENIAEVFWIGSPDWRHVIFISSTYEDVWGRPCRELYDRPLSWIDAIHPDDRDAVVADVERKAAGDLAEPRLPEFRVVRPDGGVRWICARAFPVRDEKGEVVRIAGLAEDVTRRKRLERQLVRNERLAALGRLVAVVSHELRNPLAAIRTSAHLLRRGLGRDDARLAASVERIDRNVGRCEGIVRELLEFTRAPPVERRPVALDAWLDEVLDEQDMPPDVALRRTPGLGGRTVDLDPERLRRALVNVIENACQAMAGDDADGGKVLSVRTAARGGRVEIAVEDTGPGIPPETRERVFEPLFSTRKYGAGLGMPIVRRIMEQHGGGVDLETEVGRGTCVRLWIDPEAAAAPAPT